MQAWGGAVAYRAGGVGGAVAGRLRMCWMFRSFDMAEFEPEMLLCGVFIGSFLIMDFVMDVCTMQG